MIKTSCNYALIISYQNSRRFSLIDSFANISIYNCIKKFILHK